MTDTFHIFSGKFESVDDACKYSQEQWEEYIPFQETEAEEKEPTWQLLDDLGVEYMDSDMIETIHDPDMRDYLFSQLANLEDKKVIEESISEAHNTLVLIYSDALEGNEQKLKSTPKLEYHGEYPVRTFDEIK